MTYLHSPIYSVENFQKSTYILIRINFVILDLSILVDSGIICDHTTRNFYTCLSEDKYSSIANHIMDADYTQLIQISIINQCEINTMKQFIYTVFYHKFGFPYSIEFRTISFRTCKLALVPTYNYLLQIILVQIILVR